MLLILARQAIGDGIKAGRDISATYPMLKAIEVTEDYARHLDKLAENAARSKPLPTLDESLGDTIAQGLKPEPPKSIEEVFANAAKRPLDLGPEKSPTQIQGQTQKIQLPLRGSTNASDDTAPLGPERA